MVDDSELEYLVTFIDEATTALTVNSYKDKRKIDNVDGAKKCLIEPGEILSVDGAFFKKRYKVKLGLESEENIMAILNEIMAGIVKYNKKDGTFTEVSVMCNIKFAYSNKAWVTPRGRWQHDFFLDVEWATS